jgi:DNA-directed RNA polymerase subunit RPC12/RpoP
LVLSDPTGPDVDLLLPPRSRDELGRALFLGGSAAAVAGATVDGDSATIRAEQGEVSVRVGGDVYNFELGPAAEELGERLLARPFTYEVECPRCGARATESSTIAPTGDIAMERAASTWWSCARCSTRVRNSDFVGDSDDVWRFPGDWSA